MAVPAAHAQTVWYVDDDGNTENGCTSWADACPELQTALSLANPNDQVWVAVGTYKPDYDVSDGQHTGDRTATFQLISGVAVYGGFDGMEGTLEDRVGLFNQTILTGDLTGDDVPVPCEQDYPDCTLFGGRCLDGFCIIEQNKEENAHHVTTGSGTDPTAFLDGFTITAGNANGVGQDRRGAGMYNLAGSPTVTNCTFSGNNVGLSGGGMYNTLSSSPTVTNCTFSGNESFSGGGGMYNFNSSPTVTNCTFSRNEGFGGGGIANVNGSSPLIKNCLFAQNAAVGSPDGSGGAVVNVVHCTPILDSCRFIENSANFSGGGVRSFFHSDAVVNNCTFIGNSAQSEGGAMFNQSSSPTLTNCTFSGNSAEEGSAVKSVLTHRTPSNPTLENCILWNNSPDPITQDAQSSTMVRYSDVQGGWPGEGNIDLDPLFVDAGFWDDNGTPEDPDDDFWVDGDYHLLPGSPCIDAADNTAVPEGIVTDLDANPRFVDDPNTDDTGFGDPPIVDMGAYEFQFQDPCADDDGDGRVTICHIPPGNPDNAHTITVSVRALPAHLAHGDHCGPCAK